MCLPHLVELLTALQPQQGRGLAAATLKLLGDGPTGLDWLAGTDTDAPMRVTPAREDATLLAKEEQTQQRSVAARWDADTAKDCCPLCLAAHRALARLL